MTRKEQNKILDAKIESSVNQYKVDRLNAEILAFSSGDLNKYDFLKRIDLNYKPNALDKARFAFSPLGKTFSAGLDKNAQGYQEEGAIKLLKDIRDSLAGGIIPGVPRKFRDDDDDDDHDDDDNMPDLETEEGAAKTNILNKIINFDEMVRNKEDEFDKMFKDKENRLNKLNNNVKKIKNYIEENNNKIIAMEHKLDYTENERNNLLLKINQLHNKLRETKNELNKSGNDELKEKVDYQKNEIKKLESELNDKDKNINIYKNNIKNLEIKNYKIVARNNEYFEEIDKLKKINNKNNQRIQELEENRIETEKKIKESNIIDDIKKSPTKIPQNVRKRDDKVRTFAPPYNVEEKAYFNEYGYNINGLDKNGYYINGLDEYSLERDSYNINGINKYRLHRDGYNINGIEGTRKKYPKRKVDYKEVDDDSYDQYGSNSEGFNEDGYNIYGFNRNGYNIDGYNLDGFDINGLNKDGANKYGYKKSSGKGLNISSLPILLSKIYTNNTAGPSALARSSKELINDIKQLVENLYKNKQITKQLYNTLSFKELYK